LVEFTAFLNKKFISLRESNPIIDQVGLVTSSYILQLERILETCEFVHIYGLDEFILANSLEEKFTIKGSF